MPLRDIVVLTLIVIVFAAFSAVLAGLTWYCRDTDKHANPR